MNATIQEYSRARFRYGAHDCCLFSARVVDAMTGSHWAESLTYRDRREALRWLKREGGIKAGVSRRLGEPSVGIPRRGDVAMHNDKAIGICVGEAIAIPGDKLEFHPIKRTTYWRV